MENKIIWYRTPIDRESMRQLTSRSNTRGLLQTGSFLSIYAGLIYLSYFFFVRHLWIPMVATCYVHSVFHCFMGMEAAVHELSHGTPFKTKKLNEFFYRLFCFLTWNNYLHFRISHTNHHQLTVHEGLDKEVIITPDPFSIADYFSWFTFDYRKFKKFIFTNLAHFFGKVEIDFFFWNPLLPSGDTRRKHICNWARFVIIGHLALLCGFIYFKLWVLIYTVTFGYFFATFLSHGCGILQHAGLNSNYPDWRVSCHTVKFNPVMSFLYWQMNFHIEHHMYAAVPFFKLPRLRKLISFDSPAPPKSYSAGLIRIFNINRRQRTDPGFHFMPDFPSTASPPPPPARYANSD